MLYALIGEDAPGALETRLAVRPQHVARLEALRDDGRLLLAGQGGVVLASQDDGHSFQVIRKEGRASLTGIHRQADGSLLLTSDSGLQRYKPTTRSAEGRSAPHTTTGAS